MIVLFRVDGDPRPQGSKRIVQPKGHARPVLIENNPAKHKAWRRDVVSAAQAAKAKGRGPFPTHDAVVLSCVFTFARPKSHRRANGSLKPRAPLDHISKPDVDKLLRAVGDALVTADVIVDDSQIVAVEGRKQWGDESSAWIAVDWYPWTLQVPGVHFGTVCNRCHHDPCLCGVPG